MNLYSFSQTRGIFLNIFTKSASFMLVLLLIMSSFSNVSFANVLTNGDEGYITNVQTVNSSFRNTNEVNSVTGAFEYKYEFKLPKGRGETTPALSLQYNSQAPSDRQIFGYGWEVSIPSIQRINKSGIESLFSTSTPHFYSSLSGEIKQIGSTDTYRAKTETGDFFEYTYTNNSWEVIDKNGVTYTFGFTASERQDDPSDSTRVYKWMLSKVEDSNGNYAVYTYTKDSGMIYPDEITYTHTPSQSSLFKVQFISTSTDSYTASSYGFPATKKYKISEVKVFKGSDVVNKYVLNYGKGINDKRDLLEGVVQTSYGENNNAVTLPEVIFDYDGSQLPSWQTDNSVDFPEPLDTHDNGVRFGDLNGDGLTDIVRYERYIDKGGTPEDYTIRRVHINQGDGSWDVDVAWNWDDIATPIFLQTNDTYGSFDNYDGRNELSKLVDVNGDGLDDYVIVYGCHYYNDCSNESDYPPQPGSMPVGGTNVYLNNGSGFYKDTSWTGLPMFILWYEPTFIDFGYQGMAFVDVNSDNLPDIVHGRMDYNTLATHPNQTVTSLVKINNGSGWDSSDIEFPVALTKPPNYSSHHTARLSHDMGVRFADVNGDGLIDVLRGYKRNASGNDPQWDERSVYINNGNGWATSSGWILPVDFVNPDYAPVTRSYHLVDVNGDHLPEIIKSRTHNGNSSYEYYLNTGSGWSEKTYQLPFYLNSGYRSYSTSKAFIDFDGDTILDVWNLNYADTNETQSSGGYVIKNTSEIPDLLTKITNEKGGVVEVEYDGYLATVQTNYETVGNSAYNPVVVVEKNSIATIGDNVVESYGYQKADFYYKEDDIFDRKFAGFGKVTKTTDLGKEISYYHQGNGVSTSSEEGIDDEALIGQVYRTEVTDLNDDLFQLNRYNFATTSLGNDSIFVKTESDLKLDYDGDGDEKASANSYTYSSTHGSPLIITEHGEVDGNTDGTFTDTGNDKRTTEYEYATNASGVVLPSKQTLKDDSGIKLKESRFYYDNQSLGSVTIGNLTKQSDWISGSNYAETERTYNTFGLVTSETDPEGNTANFDYDQHNLFVASTTNALGHNTQYEYDYSSGQVATTTNPNGEVFATIYDGLGRPLSTTAPDPQTGNPITQTEYVYTDTVGAVSIQKINHLNSGLTHNSYSFLDGFGRVIQERQEAETVNQYVVRDYIYGNNGQLEKESLPYFSTGTSSTNTTTDQDLFSTYVYDALARVTAVGTAVGTTTTSHDQWTETITDTAGNDKEFAYDAFGRLSQVTENEDSTAQHTNYLWDEKDDLIKITDAEGNVRNIEYDGLSRRTSLEDLHDPNDSSYGVWDFTYDDVGNMTEKIDPNGNTINYTYDALNRQLTENYTGESGTEVTYTYDTCMDGVGQLCSVANSSVTTNYTYTPNGLLATEAKIIDSTTYTTDYEYDHQGNQTLITHPDDSEVKYTYHKGGQIDKVEQRENGEVFSAVIENVDYGPHRQMENIEYGNGAKTTRTYDVSELYRLGSILTTATSTYGTGGPGNELVLVEAELADLTTEDGVMTESAEEITSELIGNNVSEVIEEEISKTQETNTDNESIASENEMEAEDQEGGVEFGMTQEDVTATTSDTEIGEVATNTATSSNLKSDINTDSSTEVANGADDIVFDLATSSTSSLDVIPSISTTETNTTPEISEKVIKEVKTKSKIKLPIKNTHDARVWQKFYEERLVGLKTKKNIDQKTLASAEYSKNQIEAFLVEEKYIKKKGDNVKGHAKEYVERKGKKFLEKVKDVILPATVESYLFDTEDFEDCSTIPCSFDSDASWGSVTPSLDSSGQIEGNDSLKETVTGSGGGGLEFSGQNEDEIYVQFKVYIPSNMTWGASGYYNILQLNDSSNNSVFWLTVEDWGTARLTMMGDALTWTDTGLDLTKGAVNTIEVRFKKGATNGDVDIWLDNTTEGSPDYDGSGALNTGTDNVDDVQVGVTYAPETISTTYFDDVAIDTAFIGTLTSGGGGNPNVPFVETVQDLTYTYDSVGNVTKIVDDSETDGATTVDYTYDDLYRLTSASTTNASTTPYNETYTYNSIGNIITKSDIGTYTYEGGQSSGSSYTFYEESVATGWADWSWWTTMNPSNTSPVQTGTYSLSAVYSQPWAGISYHHNNFDSSPYDDLELSVYTSTTTDLYLYLTDSNGDSFDIVELKDYVTGSLTANTWHDLTIPLFDLDYENYQGATELNIETSATSTVYLDNIKFTGGSGGGDNYANPHAATTIGGDTQTYDHNGNLLTTGTLTNTWNYRNELTQTIDNNATTTYTYDHTGQRIKKANATTTLYPFSNYEIKDNKVTKHIYLNNTLIATIEEDTPAPSIYYNHTDHLNSTTKVTDKDGYLNQLLSYQPFGGTRIDERYDSVNQTNRFTGHDYDQETGFSYMGARYQSGETGRFVSQDPLFITLGLANILTNPQKMNSYAYVVNNPLVKIDPTGKSDTLTNIFMNMQRVDNASGGYISNETNNYKQAVQTAVEMSMQTAELTPVGDVSVLAMGQTLSGQQASKSDYAIAVAGITGGSLGKTAGKILGGAYKNVKGVVRGNEAHHMPANSISPLNKGDGPAISMTKADHMKTASWGSSNSAVKYRSIQQQLLIGGKFNKAFEMDVSDVQSKFGNKYDNAIGQAREHVKKVEKEVNN